MKEEASPNAFGLTVRDRRKDYYQQSGDYSYVEVEHDGILRLAEALKLGYTAGVKSMDVAPARPRRAFEGLLGRQGGRHGDAGDRQGNQPGRWPEAAAGSWVSTTPAPGRHAVVAASFSTRIGEWLLGARYRGEFRLPLGEEAA